MFGSCSVCWITQCVCVDDLLIGVFGSCSVCWIVQCRLCSVRVLFVGSLGLCVDDLLTGTLGCVWFVFWMLLVHDSPAQHPRISASEQKYIEGSIKGEREVWYIAYWHRPPPPHIHTTGTRY